MKALVLGLVALVISVSPVLAEHHSDVHSDVYLDVVPAWPGTETITLYDYSDDRYTERFETEVNEFNANLPIYAPEMVYVRESPSDCNLDLIEDSITVCMADPDKPEAVADATWWVTPYDAENKAMIRLKPTFTPLPRDPIPCHEMMHVVTYIADNYGANPDSCVWGYTEHLGSFDIQHMIDVFPYVPAPPKEHHKKRHHGHKNHR